MPERLASLLPGDRALRRAVVRIATAGMLFQGGAAAVDSATIVGALVFRLTGSSLAVGIAAALARIGWLFPQLIVAHLAQTRHKRMPFYTLGALGRALCLAVLAALMVLGAGLPGAWPVAAFFALWTLYTFTSGIVGVPYNDIVARRVPSAWRSRLLAWRFFGGGLCALLVAGAAHRLLAGLAFPAGYGLVFALGAALLLASAAFFISAGEPEAPHPREHPVRFGGFLAGGLAVFREDERFRRFLQAQWIGGLVQMAYPFYIVQAKLAGVSEQDVAVFAGAQTAGAVLSNALWGWWGDRRGKLSLLRGVALLGAIAPAVTLGWLVAVPPGARPVFFFAAVFFLIGAVANGWIIAQLGYLMEISPDAQRPAYSGYFNVLVAPAGLLPIVGARLGDTLGYEWVFALAPAAALTQFAILGRMRRAEEGLRR